jgi:hypothetical protein
MDFTNFMTAVSGMESDFGRAGGSLYGMTSAAGGATPLSLAKSNLDSLTKSLGGAPTDFQQYVAWQQGATGGANLLKADPKSLASSIVPLKNLTGNIGTSSGLNAATMTTGEFLGYLSGKWAKVGGSGGYDAAAGSSTTASTATAPTPSAAPGVTDWIADYFIRATLIMLGFIFMAAGLLGFVAATGAVDVRKPGVGPRPLMRTKDITKRPATQTRTTAPDLHEIGAMAGRQGFVLRKAATKAPAKRKTKDDAMDDKRRKMVDAAASVVAGK